MTIWLTLDPLMIAACGLAVGIAMVQLGMLIAERRHYRSMAEQAERDLAVQVEYTVALQDHHDK